jgi:prepilin-type N-terminal cleavage/methylation domain-containing protein
MDCKITFTKQARPRGFTLVEMMIALAIGSTVLTSLALLVTYTSRSFAAMINYVDLDQRSRNALDRLSMEIRQADRLMSSTTNQLTFSYNGGTLSYTYDRVAKTLTRTFGGESQVLLRECEKMDFSIYQRNPVGGTYDVYPTGTPSTTKLVQITWTCSRSILGQAVNTESVQSAKFVLRKQ